MRSLKIKRAQEGIANESIIGLILLVLVVTAVVTYIIREDVIGKLNLIPQLAPENRTIDSVRAAQPSGQIFIPVAKIVTDRGYFRAFDTNKIYFCEGVRCEDPLISKLIWKVDDKGSGQILVTGGSVPIGSVDKYNINIFYEYLFSSPEYETMGTFVLPDRDWLSPPAPSSGLLPPLTSLQKLQGSFYSGGFLALDHPFDASKFPAPFARVRSDAQINQIIYGGTGTGKTGYRQTNFYISGDKIKLSNSPTALALGNIINAHMTLHRGFKQSVLTSSSPYSNPTFSEDIVDPYYKENIDSLKNLVNKLDGAEIKGEWIFAA